MLKGLHFERKSIAMVRTALSAQDDTSEVSDLLAQNEQSGNVHGTSN
jgi:hypothetical protein